MAVVFAKALYSFEGARSDNLPFKEGDIITVLKQDPSGWWQGSTLDGRIGIFPRNYVELNEVRDCYDVGVAEFNFESDKEGDLPFSEGEEIIVLKQLSADWWKGRKANDRTKEGIFPSAYIVLNGEVDYATAEEESKKWTDIAAQAKATALDIQRKREEAEAQLEIEREQLDQANQQAAQARMALEAENRSARDAQRELELQEAKKHEQEVSRAREEAERKMEEAQRKLQAMKLEEEASKQTLEMADQKREKAQRKKKEDDDRFMDFDDPGKKPVREVKQEKQVVPNRFAALGGGSTCAKCQKTVGHAEKAKGPGDAVYHKDCLRCSTCDKLLTNGQFSENNNLPYCQVCYGRGFGPKGFGFGGSVASVDSSGDKKQNASGAVDNESPMEALKRRAQANKH
ncbi:hypothetical protein BASA81_005462 [Batrachochytrium salamandrivorans]|nr:hypothetical protein BASA81_005462 [Batrachochytrium salamandrivorans]